MLPARRIPHIYLRVSNIDQQGAKPGFNMTSVALGEGKSARRLAMVDVMSSLLRKRTDKQIGYSVSQLVQLRHQMLRFARSLPPGPDRNQRRQIASSLRSLARRKR
jgi:hypothetical protein